MYVGSTSLFKCIHKGHVEWKHENMKIDETLLMDGGHILLIKNTLLSHYGTYKCLTFSDGILKFSDEANLKVIGILLRDTLSNDYINLVSILQLHLLITFN